MNPWLGRGALLAALWISSSAGASEGYLRLKRVQIVDRNGFEKPIPALSVLIPRDWSFDGQAQYAQHLVAPLDIVKLTFRAASPDHRTGFELFPDQNWSWTDDPMMRQAIQNQNAMAARMNGAQTTLMAPLSARDFLTRVAVPRLRPGAKISGVEPIPDADAPIRQLIQQAQASQPGIPLNLKADHARARVHTPSGEEWITAVIFTRATPVPTLGGGRSLSYECAARFLYGLRAPEGGLEANDALYRTVLSTIRIDPTWQSRVTQAQMQMQATNLKGVQDRSRIIAQSAEDQRRIIKEGYENRQRTLDRTNAEFSDALRGVQNFRNPATGEAVQLDNRYANAWASGDGEYVVSDSSSFNPNSVLQGHWTRLEPVHR